MPFFRKPQKVITDDAKIRELLTRGVEHIYPSREFLDTELHSGRRLRLYLGIDPTGPTLHIGHLIPLLKLWQFQQLGHHVILLIGDFTAQIGDPTDKLSARKPLTEKEVLSNAKLYKRQASKILRFDGPNPAEITYNSKWLGELTYGDFYRLSSLVTVDRFLKRDMFVARQQSGRPVFMHEFTYPLLQGYDSVAMNVDGEVGGNDQTFNMLIGRDLVSAIQRKEKFAIAVKILADSSGKKVGKTEGNMVTFSDTPGEVFGKLMSWPDSMILMGLELCTRVPTSEIAGAKQALGRGENPKNLKARFAEAVVSLLYGSDAAKKAHAGFDAAFSEGKPGEFIELHLSGREIAQALIEKNVIASKTELRRLLLEGAITNLDSNAKMGEEFLKAAPLGKYRIGKHRFVEIK